MILFWYSNVVTFGDIYSPRQGRGVKTIHSCSSDGGSSEIGGGAAIIDECTLILQILLLILLKSEGVPPTPGSSGPRQKPIDLSVNNLDYRSFPARIISFFFSRSGRERGGCDNPIIKHLARPFIPCSLHATGP